jgi:hypothetical protein
MGGGGNNELTCHDQEQQASITSASMHTSFILIVSGDKHATLLIVSLLPSLFSTSYYLVSGNTQ